jgi:hypothetical protein
MKRCHWFFFVAVIWLLPPGCSKKMVKYAPSQSYSSDNEAPKKMRAPGKTFVSSNAETSGYLDNPTSLYILDSPENETYKQEQSLSSDNKGSLQQQIVQQVMSQGQVRGKQKRMVTYDGFITTRCTKPDSLITTAVAFAESLKGYVEMRNNASVTLRIPVAVFDAVYDSLLKLGEVVDYQKSSEDITDAFRDTDLRVTVLEKTIERYVKLIRLVKEDKEKISLLKEIERLREELEVLRVRKSVLALRAEFAKVQFTVQQITTGFAGIVRNDRIHGFEWMAFLDPVNFYRFGKRHKIPVPEGMVRLKNRNFWIAQSPAGSRTWTARVQNKPQGTSDFWIDAVACKLREQFLVVDTASAAGYRFAECTPQPGVNYRYRVGVKVVGTSICIIQCFFPDEIQEGRYFGAVIKALETAGGAS